MMAPNISLEPFAGPSALEDHQDPVSLPLRYVEGPESRIEGLRDASRCSRDERPSALEEHQDLRLHSSKPLGKITNILL